MMKSIVTRFPPSPTGYVHIGSLRTVLYNYLYAKRYGGKMILRIEDTDRTRLVEGSVDNMLQVLASVGLMPDEGPNNPGNLGPYFQSERLDIYTKYAQELIEKDQAYYCFCTSERLDELRAEQESLKLPTKYDGKCRYLSKEEINSQLKSWISYTIRLKVPKDQNIVFDDIIRWRVEINTRDIDDQVLMKSDGYPTYHLANVIDDHMMGVTHVIRGEEWVSSTPKHVLLYRAFWWEQPLFAHLPLLLGKDKKKLSKRSGDVSVESYLEKWYPTEAILNYIALLGWNPKTTEEFFTIQDLIEKFDLNQVHKAGAIFDIERLEWFSWKYIAKMLPQELFSKLTLYFSRYDKETLEIIEKNDSEYNLKILSEIQGRMKKYSEFKELSHFFYTDLQQINTDYCLNEKMWIQNFDIVKKALHISLTLLESIKDNQVSLEILKERFIEATQKAWLKNGQVLWPTRIALTGELQSPGAFESIVILGREKSIQRIWELLKLLS